MVKQVIVEHACHKGRPCVFLKFEYEAALIALVKTIADARWSNTHKALYISYYKGAVDLIQNTLKPAGIRLIQNNSPEEGAKPVRKPAENTFGALPPLIPEQELQIRQFTYWMRSRRYGESTIKSYTDALKVLLRFYAHKPISEITNEDLVVFNYDYILASHFSASYQNQVVNAVKLFFISIENKAIDLNLVHRPKREKVLPNVLSKEEVKRILAAPLNVKHKAMLSLIYSCGLRCGELIKLRPEHIDSQRGLVLIKQAKGKKDRIVPLSSKILQLLRDYYIVYKPDNWLFEGQVRGNMYDERSLQSVLKQSVAKAGIIKPVTLHWLRHSYATHLLESGTDLRYIQELLGHSRSTTTEIYTHVSNKEIQKIVSPFDSL
jgi:integrase/recombinase XerD